MKCFYHSADLDGHCSGAIIKYKHPECEMFGINYGDDFPWDGIQGGERVFMADFSMQPFDGMVKLAGMCNLVWIDHHKSAIEEAHKEGFLAHEQALEIGTGACALVWEYCYPGSQLPEFIRLLAEYDVWNHSDPRTLPFQFGARLFPTIPGTEDGMRFWSDLFDDPNLNLFENVLEKGEVVLEYQARENRKYVSACGFETRLDKLRCIAINKMLTNSQIFESVWDPDKYDAMLTFGYRKGKYTVSLYSDKPNVDVSVIAKAHGGGGHKGAAGFQCDELPFNLG